VADEPKKVAYLFGAGATHAELKALKPDLQPETEGLLIRHLSSRVMERARENEDYVQNLETVSAAGLSNIELLISLIENSRVDGWASKTQILRELVAEDIKAILTPYRKGRFYLHRALLRFHRHRAVRSQEEVIGLISLNYDDVLDRAYRQQLRREPNYCFTLDDSLQSTNIPLLKLHGSFNWSAIQIRGRTRAVEIIPLGATKSYLHAPYASIWNRALDLLIKCDTLRVIGCSLSQNDVHLIDLLFKAHLERQEAFDIEIIASEKTGRGIRDNYGFFPKIKTLVNIDNLYFPEEDPPNPFKEWLKYKSTKMLGEARVKSLEYLRNVAE
jgi:hypothetical protein